MFSGQGKDSNLRCDLRRIATLASCCLKPLSHLSSTSYSYQSARASAMYLQLANLPLHGLLAHAHFAGLHRAANAESNSRLSSYYNRKRWAFHGAWAIASKLSRNRGTKNSGYPIQDIVRKTGLLGELCVWQCSMQQRLNPAFSNCHWR
jgi:hypothetical protein